MKTFKQICSLLLLSSCLGYPKNIEPVQNFEVEKYLGNWYEIARLDHSFERGLSQASATYSMREDGGVNVLNKGFDTQKGEWSEAEGKAYFVESPKEGYLKVSFFGPFYGSYVIFELDEKYQYAFISGNTKDYLWFLSRTSHVSDELKQHFIEKATDLGFPTDQLIFVNQDFKE